MDISLSRGGARVRVRVRVSPAAGVRVSSYGIWILYGNSMVDFPFIVSLYVSDLHNVTKKYHPHSASQVPYGTRQNSYTSTVLFVTLGKSETYKETINGKIHI